MLLAILFFYFVLSGQWKNGKKKNPIIFGLVYREGKPMDPLFLDE